MDSIVFQSNRKANPTGEGFETLETASIIEITTEGDGMAPGFSGLSSKPETTAWQYQPSLDSQMSEGSHRPCLESSVLVLPLEYYFLF